eukprot:TRINITY_DN15047_c0_g7_i1.p1 TRINITY_DN15047_c0_g7~~TRINITY_DN15047_c0_g7_i1.p1  ORF type:complete len:340 (-),score=80.84 TRINITY_DN15047_c0_g7_i1:24-1043(-)
MMSCVMPMSAAKARPETRATYNIADDPMPLPALEWETDEQPTPPKPTPAMKPYMTSVPFRPSGHSLAEAQHHGPEVALSVYALNGAKVLNAVAELTGLGGAYHVGVEVYSLEWSFGWCERGSGVHNVHVGCSEAGDFRERIPLGRTTCAPEEVIAILDELRRAWRGASYDLLTRNCVHFSIELLKRLRVGEVPTWVNSLNAFVLWLAEILSARPVAPALPAGSPATKALVADAVTAKTLAAVVNETEAITASAPPAPLAERCTGDGDEIDENEEGEGCGSALPWRDAQQFIRDRAEDLERARRRRADGNELPSMADSIASAAVRGGGTPSIATAAFKGG